MLRPTDMSYLQTPPFFLISSETGELVWDQTVLALLFGKLTNCVFKA